MVKCHGQHRRQPSKECITICVGLLAVASIILFTGGVVAWSSFESGYSYWLNPQHYYFNLRAPVAISAQDRPRIIQDVAVWGEPLSWLLRGQQQKWHKYPADIFTDDYSTIGSSAGGISFRRSVETYDPVSFLSVHFDGSQDGKRHCHTTDEFGDNACHFDWNDQLVVDYSVFINETLTEEAYVSGVFQIDARIPWAFRCPLCGGDCVWKVPFVDFNYTWSLPPCPLNPQNISDSVQFHLWRASPDNSWMAIPFKGLVSVYSRPTMLLANLTVLLTVK